MNLKVLWGTRGHPCTHRTKSRRPQALIVNLVANGMTTQEIIDEYPDLEPEGIRQALQYAAWAADDTIYMGLTQDELARRIGTKQSSISRPESGSWLVTGWAHLSVHKLGEHVCGLKQIEHKGRCVKSRFQLWPPADQD